MERGAIVRGGRRQGEEDEAKKDQNVVCVRPNPSTAKAFTVYNKSVII